MKRTAARALLLLAFAATAARADTVADGGVILFGQGGALQVGPDGLNVIVPDAKGQYRVAPVNPEEHNFGYPTPPAQASGVQAEPAAPGPQYAPAEAPPTRVVCECNCPACPALPSPGPSPNETSVEGAYENSTGVPPYSGPGANPGSNERPS